MLANLAVPLPRGARFGSPLVLSRLHWVRRHGRCQSAACAPFTA
jgi:hypothetical protein